MNEEVMRKHYERTPKETLINILISSREEVEKLQKRNKECKQEIERLNNIINDLLNRQNEALKYISNFLSMNDRYKHGNGDEELILVRRILNKHNKELKGDDKE